MGRDRSLGPRREAPNKVKIAETVTKFLAERRPAAMPEGALQLNPGFFLLEEMRSKKDTKLKSDVAKQPKGN